MLCDRVLGNLYTNAAPNALPDARVDWVDITWQERALRALRKRARGGRELKLLLPRDVMLEHGDVLIAGTDGLLAVAVNLLPCEVFVARPATLADAARLAHELGNLHAPMETDGDAILCLADGPVEAVLIALGVPYDVVTRRFRPRVPQCGPQFAADFRVERG